MSGPKPTPTVTLAQRGSWLAKTREGEPHPPMTYDAIPPASLPAPAQVIYGSLAPRLVSCGLLTDADLQTFERYCRLRAAWNGAMTAVEADPTERLGILALAKLDAMVRELEAAFGLTPSDRTGIRVDKAAPSGKARFFDA